MWFTKSRRPKREDFIKTPLISSPPPPPIKKRFKTMYELLRDAEKYDDAGEEETSNKTLETLKDYILSNCS